VILALCLNCSLDTRYTVPGFRAGAIHSVPPPSVTAGGKGLNLARVAAQLGAEVTALGLVGERELDFFTAAMAAQGAGVASTSSIPGETPPPKFWNRTGRCRQNTWMPSSGLLKNWPRKPR